MKRITATTLLTLLGIFAVGNSLAQSHEVRASVPFAFTAGNKILPAGDYSITPVSEGTIQIRNRDNGIAVLALAHANSNLSKNGAELVFDKYADQYFLRHILSNSDAMNMDLPATKSESQARMQEARVQNASQVLIAAK